MADGNESSSNEKPSIIWPTGADSPKSRAKELEDEFKDNLRTIAERLTSHERLKRIDVRHVNDAHSALAQSGLSRRRFLERPETMMSIGAFFFGFAWACPDVLTLFFPPDMATPISQGTLAGCIVLGIACFLLGWTSSKLPPPPTDSFRVTVKRTAVVVLLILSAVGITYMATIRFVFDTCPHCAKEGSDIESTEERVEGPPEKSILRDSTETD